VDNADEIDAAWLDGARTIGLTSGASVPEALVQGVVTWLGENGFPIVEEHRTTEESLIFSLPRELRGDLKSAADHR
jgi:4-hydroxy-3-methylbut-2-enyl diphosphate reductase